MTGSSNVLTRYATEWAVYWGNPQGTGSGGRTFDDPVEIKVRWDDESEVFRTADGKELVSSAIIYPLQDLDRGGYLYRGRLTDLSVAEQADPLTVTAAYPIMQWRSVKSVDGTRTVRQAWL